jgi:hypothetical protein
LHVLRVRFRQLISCCCSPADRLRDLCTSI